jgi:ABC-type transport system involved in multi-copper enzyme maturation permease subunit
MAVFTIAGLTLKEAVRRRTFVGALLLGLLVLGLSTILIVIRSRMQQMVLNGSRDALWYAIQFQVSRSIVTSLCLFAIRTLASLFAILLAGGSISSEIERGLLAVILPKPIPRWQILAGKWLGLNTVLVGSTLVWTLMVWGSLTLQTHEDLTPILQAGLYLSLFPVVICTLTLSLSTMAQRLLGTSLALTLAAFSWLDGVFNAMGDPKAFDVAALKHLADFASLVVPQGCIAWWVEDSMESITFRNPRIGQLGDSPQFVKEWGMAHLHYPHLDAVYLAAYILVVFVIGMIIFQKRDV